MSSTIIFFSTNAIYEDIDVELEEAASSCPDTSQDDEMEHGDNSSASSASSASDEEEEVEEERTLTKPEMEKRADEDTIKYIREKIAKETFLDRTEVCSVWNDFLKTLAFRNGECIFKVPTLRGAAVQERILDAWEAADERDLLMFTFIARKAGEL